MKLHKSLRRLPMLKILSYGAAFAAGVVVANGEVREGVQLSASNGLRSVASIIRPETSRPLGGPYDNR